MDRLLRNLPHTDAIRDEPFRRIEVITGVERRRRWSEEDKARIVAESLEPGVIVADVARRYGIHRRDSRFRVHRTNYHPRRRHAVDRRRLNHRDSRCSSHTALHPENLGRQFQQIWP